jgi:hypothetical protein
MGHQAANEVNVTANLPGQGADSLFCRLFNEPTDAVICISLAPETVSLVFIGCAEYFAFVCPLIL